MRWRWMTGLAALAAMAWAGAALADGGSAKGPATGLTLPRFESLGVDEAFGRNGPGGDHRIDWVYRRRGLPVEILEEARQWRRVRDPAGDLIWLHESRLTPRRMIMITTAEAPLVSAPRAQARVLARLRSGVVGALVGCLGPWREITVGDRRGWVDASGVWGAPDCTGIAPAQP